MRFSWLILLCFLYPIVTHAQSEIAGKVTRKDSKSPVAGASVFLGNSSFGTATASNGTFTLNGVKPGQYTLVVTIMGFEDYTQTVLVGKEPIKLNIELSPKSIILREVEISTTAKADWKRNYEQFKKEFIGTDENAKNCEVINPEVLYFTYHKTQKVLEASADEFLIVENRGLGYRVKFLVRDFRSDHISGIISYSGQRLFQELPGKESQKKKWRSARNYTYYGSAMHFYRSLYKDRLVEEGFEMHHYTRLINPLRPPEEVIQRNQERYYKLRIRDSLIKWNDLEKLSIYYKETIYPMPLFTSEVLRSSGQQGIFGITFPDLLYVIYNKKREETPFREVYRTLTMPNYETTILSFTDKNRPYSFFDMNGILVGGGILNEGTWSKARLSELLPVDYVPTEDVDATLKAELGKKH
ncbi:MAG: hypothetical protein JWQ06_609 [Mucilaginibacter sp.]|nr:hypothetical protein [Mucilaginibacter sp.]